MRRQRTVKDPNRFTPRAVNILGWGHKQRKMPGHVYCHTSTWTEETDQPAPRRVPLGFNPRNTTDQIRLEGES